jgi:hypothetical protein
LKSIWKNQKKYVLTREPKKTLHSSIGISVTLVVSPVATVVALFVPVSVTRVIMSSIPERAISSVTVVKVATVSV